MNLSQIRRKWSSYFAGPDGYIKAWTFVPNEIVEQVISGVITECPSNCASQDADFKRAYAWMAGCMDEAEIVGRRPGISPWWCWLKVGGKYTKPTTIDAGDNQTLLEIRLLPDQVLFSDFTMWHLALNYWLHAEEKESDSFDEELQKIGLSIYRDKPLPEPYHSKVINSWRVIFELDHVDGFTSEFSKKGIQGVLWRLMPEMIVGPVKPDLFVDEE